MCFHIAITEKDKEAFYKHNWQLMYTYQEYDKRRFMVKYNNISNNSGRR